jgi:hypothetical protein
MKPKTKLHKEVHSLVKHVKPLPSDLKKHIIEKKFYHYVYKLKNTATCFTCGHTWEDKTPKNTLLHSIGGYVCPKCNRNLIALSDRSRTSGESKTFHQITTVKNWQVVRTFEVHRYCRAHDKAKYTFYEVVQMWINEKGRKVNRAMLRNPMNNSSWQYTSELEIRSDQSELYYVGENLPKAKVLPIVRRNGYNRTFHKLHPAWFCELVLGYQKAETLLKAKQYPLFERFHDFEYKIQKYWSSIKICIRNNYLIENPSDYFDHLELLYGFRKDLLNPHYVCPSDFKAEHQRYIDYRMVVDQRNREIQAEIDAKENAKELAKANKKYIRAKKKFFDLFITNGEISITPLKSVEEFMIEGKTLRHCIYSNGYYNRENSLILSAKKEKTRLETIEIDLRDFRIAQARGRFNESSKYHDQILDLVSSHIFDIKKLTKTK